MTYTKAHTQNPLVSVVVPVYNSETSLRKTVESLFSQTLDKSKVEIILVNDGSSDKSLYLCHELAAKAKNITVVDKPNGGVSSARNAGIDTATGKYIAFLDSDDTLLPTTLEAACSFFERYYDEIDLVTYPMKLYNKSKEWAHVREEVLTKTGIYDLTKLQYAFSLVTNINIVVKNNAELPRYREDLSVHEDLQFILSILLKKLKVGFSKAGAYRYQQLPNSAIHVKMHQYYQFENNMRLWEDLFSKYPKNAPIYLQASFLNEMNWKLKQDLIFPYHYSDGDFQNAMKRIRLLMSRVEDDVIMTSPRADDYLKHYFISLKSNAKLSCVLQNENYAIYDDDKFLLCRNKATLIFNRTRIVDGVLTLKGILQSLSLPYVTSVSLYVYINETDKVDIPLTSTSHNRHLPHVQTNLFWGFEAQIPLEHCSKISFSLIVDDHELPLDCIFGPRANLNTQYGINSFTNGDTSIAYNPKTQGLLVQRNKTTLSRKLTWIKNTVSVFKVNKKAGMIRALVNNYKKTQPIWLYYDCKGIGKDNSYYQFLHDYSKNDGIRRFYVTRDSIDSSSTLFNEEQQKSVLAFKSLKHRILHANADCIIASYIEHPNWCPFNQKTMQALADTTQYTLVYLQHGVLHAHMPWKYSADRLLIDYEVISSNFEYENLTQNYHFKPKQLIKSGMPRYDFINNHTPSQKRILFAPSWRKNLVEELPNLTFDKKEGAFYSSVFWEETKMFLANKKLISLLEQFDYRLDIKLHPIFNVYASDFKRLSDGAYINVVDDVHESDYQIVITDYSSWVYDFVYLNRAIIYFFPDKKEFNSGLNGYRSLDLPLENGFGPLAYSANELIAILQETLESDGKSLTKYKDRMSDFFFYDDDNQRERLYAALACIKKSTKLSALNSSL